MKKMWFKFVALVLVISTLLTALPTISFAEGSGNGEVYIKTVQLARAETKEEAKSLLEDEGYIFLNANLNEGTGEDGIWMGYTTTTNPEEAVYDLKLMNMNGGFTLTSMEAALAAQESLFAQMATDLNYLIEEFAEAYEEESVPALKAYKALNFFRIVEDETELEERNGLGYQIVSGNMTVSKLTEMLLLCDANLVDSIIKILVTGVQIRNGNWMKKLSEMGPYDAEEDYYEDECEDEFKRRAEELLPVLQLYSQAYNAMDLSGLIPDKLNENFEAEYSGNEEKENLSADDAAVKKLDESRYKMYKIVFDELAKYQYGTNETLKDFFCSLENEGSTKDLYPLVAVLSDAEFAALSYGCFLEVVTGATASPSDFDSYDEVYDTLTKDVKSVYLYHGVDDILWEDDTVIGFTETATRHMATTGEMEFYEKETDAEQSWESGKNASVIIASVGMGLIGITKITTGVAMGIVAIASAVESSVASSAALAGIIKYGTMMGGIYAMLGVALAVGISYLVSFIWSVVEEEINGSINWDENPMPEYLYDVKEVGFSQTSVNDGIATGYMKKPVFALYKAVTDKDGEVVDLNKRTDNVKEALTDLVVFEGDEPETNKRLDINGKSVKYTLASEVDLNSNAGGKWLYLYSSDSADTGNPIKGLRVEGKTVSYLKCGVEEVTVKLAKDKVITNENIDLNKSAGGEYLYLIMNRETTAGHDYSILKKKTDVPATCGEDGALTGYYECSLCGADGEVVEKVYPATGKHKDAEGDGNHKCDVCGAKNITAHVEGEVQREDEEPSFCKEQGSYHLVVYCVECEDELRNTVLYLPLDPDNHKDGKDADHNCDYCGLKIEDHTAGKPVEKDRVEPTEDVDGSYKKVVYCKECGEKLSEETIVIPALKKEEPDDSELVASLFGEGSIVIICSIAGLAILVAIIIYIQKKKKGNKGEKEDE